MALLLPKVGHVKTEEQITVLFLRTSYHFSKRVILAEQALDIMFPNGKMNQCQFENEIHDTVKP